MRRDGWWPEMHPNPIYRNRPDDQNMAFALEKGFGALTVSAQPYPLVAHVPFVPCQGGVEFHLVRSNPVARAVPAQAVLIVEGPEGYISPDWYGMTDQVPTWNYVAVHLRGRLQPVDDLPGHLDRLSAHFEQRLLPKPPWTSAKMDAQALARMQRMILPFRLLVDQIDGTWKFSQNKPDAARLAAADHVAPDLAALMRRG